MAGTMNQKTLYEAIEESGGLSVVAEKVGVSAQTLSNWRVRMPPEDYCPSLELALNGLMDCETLRPDTTWVRIKDRAWPNPKGRPLVDHSSKVAVVTASQSVPKISTTTTA